MFSSCGVGTDAFSCSSEFSEGLAPIANASVTACSYFNAAGASSLPSYLVMFGALVVAMFGLSRSA